ncbi:hypothetical protein QAD02_015987 [Eretmocerus hayati]|uniref:Uncharacterized protein n=1 Tax=Eretmocerus hayati TaxID=131215 RepID=A0ACC2P9C8_9HYME|nr:hypothetical protein QAD02_015987 [Eretmocerus hayati]
MTTAAKCGPQDMPPQGGYNPLVWERTKLKTFFTVPRTIAVFAISSIAGIIAYGASYKRIKREDIEMRSARFALLPMLMAERDRAFLKQCRINRDIERELMKDVPEWEVGTYFREPVYITKQGKFMEPHFFEFNAHGDYLEVMYRVLRRHFT